MRQMIFVAPGKLDWVQAPIPQLEGPGEAIVKPIVMGRCDLDVMYLAGRLPLAAGEPIGHEMIAEIVDLGVAATRQFHIGQRVIVSAQISCGTCPHCITGDTGRCLTVPLGASYGMGRTGGFGGAVAELVRVPFAEAMLVPIPDQADPHRMMGLADMATDAWRAVGPQLQRRPGGTVLVFGGAVPVIGIYAAALARCLGAGRTVYLDSDAVRRQAAEGYGVECVENADALADSSFDIVVDAAGDADKLLSAIRICGPAGQLTSVAPPLVSPEIPLMQSYYKGLSWTIGRPDCRNGHGPALAAWACKGFRPEFLGPKCFDFKDAIDAWLDPALYVAVTRL